MFIVPGALKSLPCFHLDTDINEILNYFMNYSTRYVKVVKKQSRINKTAEARSF